jgi:hypothetical protein
MRVRREAYPSMTPCWPTCRLRPAQVRSLTW